MKKPNLQLYNEIKNRVKEQEMIKELSSAIKTNITEINRGNIRF